MKQKIPCHIVAGFLGAGKSKFIKQLLAHKPEHEKWAVLVNEVGNSQYAPQFDEAKNIFIKEVYGGCLCCSAGMPFTVALNKLIKEVRPQRLFIEPAGAGHLENIKKVLQGPFYVPVIQLTETVCILSAEQLTEQKYAENATYLSLIAQSDKLCISDHPYSSQAQKMATHYKKSLYTLQQNQQDLAFILQG